MKTHLICFIITVITFTILITSSETRHTRHRTHRKRSADSDDDVISFDDVTLSPTSRRHRFRNVTKHDLRHSPQVRMQVAANYAERCRSGEMGENDYDVTWSKDECEICTCTLRHKEFCRKPECPNLTCQAVHVEGECCPMCPERLCRATDGRYFKDGAEWNLDDCTSCECRMGEILCSVEDCKYKSPNATKVPGSCCPVYLDTSCENEEGNPISFLRKDLCTNCYCNEGEFVCAEENCPHINCTNPFRDPDSCCYKCQDAVECVVTPWGSWEDCPVQECGGGMRRRYREVLIPPRNGGSFCPHMSEAQQCPTIPCNQIPLCPVTEWSNWGHCTATCGNGKRLRSRTRTKIEQARIMPLINCNQTHFQEGEACYAGTCKISLRNLVADLNTAVHCPEAPWSEWGPCSETCGVGVRSREQIPAGNMTSSTGNLTCHLLTETKKCHGKDCKKGRINCKVTSWGSWGPCTSSCGEDAVRSRTRTILREARNGGHPCPDDVIMTKPCKSLPSCPTDGDETSLDDEERCVSSDGIHRSEGERWSPVECVTCTCSNERKVCQPIHCAPTECKNPQKIPGFCCPFCD